MPRVNTVKKARQSPGLCGKCQKKIAKGHGYLWWKFRYGGKRVRCGTCPRPRQSELTNSDKLSRCYAAGESVQDAIDAFQKDYDEAGLRQALEDAANELREVADEYRESADNVENGMNGNRMPICDELEEKADCLDGKADELDIAAGGIQEFDEDQAKEDAETEAGEELAGIGEKDDTYAAKVEEILKEKKDEWADEQVAEAENLTDLGPE